MVSGKLLIADDEISVREAYSRMLTDAGHQVDMASNGDEVLEKVRSQKYDLLLCDLRFPPTDGIKLLEEVKRIRPSMLVVLFSGFATVDTVLDGFRAGAFDFLEKPVSRDRLLELAERASEVRGMGERRRKLARELESERINVLKLREQLAHEDPFRNLIGGSLVFRDFVDTIREVSRTDSTVLLTGESGTGKGLVARTIHDASSRSDAAFVEANCVVYSEGVLHSELFGHERGAFTGAARTKKGRFELADGGTLFLDEIGEIAPTTQLLLLRVLQERNFERVGGEATLDANVRLIAATNRDLPQAIEQGMFRSDLFYRLNVIPVQMPALREHAEDIPVLVQHFLTRCAARTDRQIEGFTDEALEALVRYSWPGNVRELENLIERVVVLNRTGVVEMQDLPAMVTQAVDNRVAVATAGTLYEMERARIIDALSDAVGNKKRAAEQLGIHRSTLYAKMRRYGLFGDDGACSDSPQAVLESETPLATV